MEKLIIKLSELDKLAHLADKSPASIHLVTQKYDHPSMKQLFQALAQHGSALGALNVSLDFPHHPYNHDLRNFDFAAMCPNLESLTVGRCYLNESVIFHPTLQRLSLKSSCLFTRDPLYLGYSDAAGHSDVLHTHITDLLLDDVNWGNQDKDLLSTLAFGPKAQLRAFSYHLDEDYSELYPESIIFESCTHLTEVSIHICGGWEVTFKGNLLSLSDVALSSQRYGDHRLSFAEVGEGSSAYVLRLRDGQGPLTGNSFLFIGKFKYLNMDKVRHIITQWGGRVVEQASPELTHVVLNDSEYAAYEADIPSPQVADITALVTQGAKIKIVNDEELRGWIIDSWY